MVPWAHPSPYPKRHLDQFSHFCTAHGRRSLLFTKGHPFASQNCPFTTGHLDPSNTWFLGPTRVHIQITSAVLQGSQQSDGQTTLLSSNRPHLRGTAMRTKRLLKRREFALPFQWVCAGLSVSACPWHQTVQPKSLSDHVTAVQRNKHSMNAHLPPALHLLI